jgi:hypothetical protein
MVGLIIFFNSNNLFAKEKDEIPIDIEDVKKLGMYEPIEELTEALEEIVGNTTGEIELTSTGKHYWADEGGWGVMLNYSDGSSVFCNKYGEDSSDVNVAKIISEGC